MGIESHEAIENLTKFALEVIRRSGEQAMA